METIWLIETRGDPQGALSRFIEFVWKEAGLEGMIVSSDALDGEDKRIGVLEQPDQLRTVHLLRPVMKVNIASDVPEVIRSRLNQRLGVLLRPCEKRALDVIAQIAPFPKERLWTIGVDCLGTYPVADIEWRTGRNRSLNDLSQETLRYARVGGIAFYRFRPACQVCLSPGAQGADLNIGVIGLPTAQCLLLEPYHAETAQRLHFAAFPVRKAGADLASRRERVLAQMVARNRLTRERFVYGSAARMPDTLDALMEHFEQCGVCQECMQICPICSVQPILRWADGSYDREGIARWLAMCVGCGMCEQVCWKKLPLSAIFGVIQEQLPAQYLVLPG